MQDLPESALPIRSCLACLSLVCKLDMPASFVIVSPSSVQNASAPTSPNRQSTFIMVAPASGCRHKLSRRGAAYALTKESPTQLPFTTGVCNVKLSRARFHNPHLGSIAVLTPAARPRMPAQHQCHLADLTAPAAGSAAAQPVQGLSRCLTSSPCHTARACLSMLHP